MNKNFKRIKNICPNPDCQRINLTQADYCAYCQTSLKETKEKAYNTTFFGQVEKSLGLFDKAKTTIGLIKNPEKVIKKSLIFKIILIIVFTVFGLVMKINNKPIWNHLAIVGNDEYTVNYKSKEFVLSTDKDYVELKIYCPSPALEVKVKNDKIDDIVRKENDKNEIKIIKDTSYVLTVIYENGTSESLNFTFK